MSSTLTALATTPQHSFSFFSEAVLKKMPLQLCLMLPHLPRAQAVGIALRAYLLPCQQIIPAAGRDLALPQDSAILPHKQQLPIPSLPRRQRTEKPRRPQGRNSVSPSCCLGVSPRGCDNFSCNLPQFPHLHSDQWFYCRCCEVWLGHGHPLTNAGG